MNYTKSIPRILIVDDNKDIHLDFRKILCPAGAKDEELELLDALFEDESSATSSVSSVTQEVQADSAYQGEEGYQKVRAALDEGRPYSLAFIDVRMPPGWDGIETTKKIWELDPEIQVVVCSAYSDYSWQDIVQQLQHTSRFLVLKKPFESIEVRQLVATLHQRWQEARYDILTGLVNRRAFLDHFHRQKKVSLEEGTPLSCIMLDLDFFKRVNDDYGHVAGDEVLHTIATLLVENGRQGDIVCRYGGEELCVLLKNANEQTAAEWANRVRGLLSKSPVFTRGTNDLFITASFGVCELNGQETTPEDVLENADIALRAAKGLGRNRVVTFSGLGDGQLQGDDGPERAQMFAGITASDVMHPTSSIQRDATLKEAAESLLEHHVTCAPVIESDGQIVGQLCERDLLQCFTEQETKEYLVGQAMNTSVVCYPEETSLQEISEFLVRVSIPQVVVVREGRPTGVIARRTLLNWLVSQGFLNDKSEAPPPLPTPLVLSLNGHQAVMDELPLVTPE